MAAIIEAREHLFHSKTIRARNNTVCVCELLCCHTVALDSVVIRSFEHEEFLMIETATRERKKSKINSFEDETACVRVCVCVSVNFCELISDSASSSHCQRWCSRCSRTVHGRERREKMKKNKKKKEYFSRFSSAFSGRLRFELKRTHPHSEWNCILHYSVSWYLRRDKKWNHFINFHFIHRFVDTHTHTLNTHTASALSRYMATWNKLVASSSLCSIVSQDTYGWLIRCNACWNESKKLRINRKNFLPFDAKDHVWTSLSINTRTPYSFSWWDTIWIVFVTLYEYI